MHPVRSYMAAPSEGAAKSLPKPEVQVSVLEPPAPEARPEGAHHEAVISEHIVMCPACGELLQSLDRQPAEEMRRAQIVAVLKKGLGRYGGKTPCLVCRSTPFPGP
jgi:hypothetical protein